MKVTVAGTVGTESEHREGSCWEGVKVTVTGTVGTEREPPDSNLKYSTE